MRVVILGASGFMGRSLQNYFGKKEDFEIIAPGRADFDLTSVSSLRNLLDDVRADAVLNLAAIATVTSQDVEAMYQINAFGHGNLLEAAVGLSRTPRILLASSANVYGQNPNSAFREDDPLRPTNHYAVSKVLAESLCGLFADRLSIAYARPFNCVGRNQGQHLMLPKLVAAFSKRDPIIKLGALDVSRDFVDMRDACQMWEALLLNQDWTGPVNFGSGRAHSIRAIVSMLEDITKHKPEIESDSGLMRPLDITYACADTRRLNQLGASTTRPLDETVRWMLDK